jgi:hypothetical protein
VDVTGEVSFCKQSPSTAIPSEMCTMFHGYFRSLLQEICHYDAVHFPENSLHDLPS